MNRRLFWSALAVQAVAVAIVSGILVALPLSDDFFEDAVTDRFQRVSLDELGY